jgi:hypothetical protein
MEVSDLYEKLVQHAADNTAKFSELNAKIEGKDMSEKIEINAAGDQSAMMMAALAGRSGGGGGDGMLGSGGILGGLLLGTLLRNGGLGGNAADGAVLRTPPEQAQANMSLMAAIGGVDKAVAVSTAAMEASQAAQSLGIQSQLSQVAAATVAQITGVKDAVNSNAMVLAQQLSGVDRSIMENRYELSKDITTDGEKTRALIVAQYEATLNRQLSEANAALIELRSDARLSERARGIEINTTNNIAQAQTQQQQQAQFGQLYAGLMDAVQSIRATNQAINVGSGVLTNTASPVSTNIR